MSRLNGWIDPETRCYVETVTAAARPGRHLPDGTIAEIPDDRSPSQRCHDGIKLGLKAGIASGELGQHRGHPVTVIARTTLAELNQAAHAVSDPDIPMPTPARTGGDTALPMRDLIRMAADGIHYLAVFDDHSDRPIYLGRQKRLATADQRIICYSRDGGCTRPNCVAPGLSQRGAPQPGLGRRRGHQRRHAVLRLRTRPPRAHHRAMADHVTDSGRLAWTNGTRPPEINHAHHPDELLHNDPDPRPERPRSARGRHELTQPLPRVFVVPVPPLIRGGLGVSLR